MIFTVMDDYQRPGAITYTFMHLYITYAHIQAKNLHDSDTYTKPVPC